MITEIALLPIRSGTDAALEAAFRGVSALLQQADGYLQHRLVRTLDDDALYLLEVHWRDLAAHVDGFEPSAAHVQFMAALSPLLCGEPTVIHVPTFAQGVSAG